MRTLVADLLAIVAVAVVGTPSAWAQPAAWFGVLCGTSGIHLPQDLPDQDKCTKTATPADKKVGCREKNVDGETIVWKPVDDFTTGTSATTGDIVWPFQSQGKARLYRWKKKDTVCWYLYRGVDRGVGGNTNLGNGVLCFNKDTCKVCALDSNTAKPTWNQLVGANQLGAGDYGETPPNGAFDCWRCHAAGTIAPKEKFFDEAVTGVMKKLNKTCADMGGPTWIGASTTWQNQPTWGTATKVAAEDFAGKSCQDCHKTGFVQVGYTKNAGAGGGTIAVGTSPFCTLIAERAFQAGGAMKENTYLFPVGTKVQCETFAAAMGCTPAQFACPAS